MKISHIETIRRTQATVQTQVQNLLRWDDLQYAIFKEDMGKEWIHHHYGEGLTLADDLVNHRIFWSWWRMHWMRRDQEFLEMSGMLFQHELEAYYHDLHEPSGVAFKPHSAMLASTYDTMIHKLVKEAVR